MSNPDASKGFMHLGACAVQSIASDLGHQSRYVLCRRVLAPYQVLVAFCEPSV